MRYVGDLPEGEVRAAVESLAHSDGVHHQSAGTDGDGNFNVDGLVEGTYAARVYVQKADSSGEWKACGSLRAGDMNADLRVQ
mgnify:CR=1 FL=1